jgi:hypothetical protein
MLLVWLEDQGLRNARLAKNLRPWNNQNDAQQ